MFNVLLEEVIGQIDSRFVVVEKKFGFLWRYRVMNNDVLESEAWKLSEIYKSDISLDIIGEI